MSKMSELAIDEQNKIKETTQKYFCEKCEEEVDETHFTMDKNGEVCDSCCQNASDLQYESWKERNM